VWNDLYPYLGPGLSTWGFGITSSIQTLTGCGYDKHCYISTANLVPAPYTTQALIQARLGGLIRLIEAVDDDQPPQQALQGDALATFNAIVQNVTTEINGYLSSIYPLPLMQTGTPAILQVATLTTDGLNGVASLNIIEGGNYLAPPVASEATPNVPNYLQFIDPLCTAYYFDQNGSLPTFPGSGLKVQCTFEGVNYSAETGQLLQAQTLTPGQTITIAAEGENYCVGDLLVLTGGQSFVPAKINEAALVLCCDSFYRRREAPEEKNLFAELAKKWRDNLIKLGNGDDGFQLDGTYKRFFSIGAAWVQNSVYFDANSV